MPLAEAQDYFVSDDGVTALEVMVDDPDDIDGMVRGIAGGGRAGLAGADLEGAQSQPSSTRWRSSAM